MSTGEDYVCTMKPETLEKAKRELNEDPKQRASHITALREWVQSQPHISSRIDSAFLVRFLRAAKFSQLRAQQLLENFWTVRSVPGKGAPEWFANMDPRSARMQETFDLGTAVPLPGRDDEGRKIILVRTGAYDPKIFPLADILKIGFINNDILLTDEENQVHGFVIVLDFGEFGANHVWYWDRDTMQKSTKCWQDTYPMRQKATHYVNTPTLFNVVHDIFMLFANEKTKRRMQFHKDNLESLHKQVPKRMLPSYLGGDAGDIDVLAKKWKDEVLENVRELDLNKGYGIDEEKKPKAQSDGWGITGAFRKINLE